MRVLASGLLTGRRFCVPAELDETRSLSILSLSLWTLRPGSLLRTLRPAGLLWTLRLKVRHQTSARDGPKPSSLVRRTAGGTTNAQHSLSRQSSATLRGTLSLGSHGMLTSGSAT